MGGVLSPGKWWWRWWCALFGHNWEGGPESGRPLWWCDFCGAEAEGDERPEW
jgi:hypothetical protein